MIIRFWFFLSNLITTVSLSNFYSHSALVSFAIKIWTGLTIHTVTVLLSCKWDQTLHVRFSRQSRARLAPSIATTRTKSAKKLFATLHFFLAREREDQLKQQAKVIAAAITKVKWASLLQNFSENHIKEGAKFN